MASDNAVLFFLNALGARWWALVLRGVVGIAFGILAIALPRDSLLVLVYLFGIYAILDGGLNFAIAAQRGRTGVRWGWWLLEGLLSVAAGVIAFVWPGITALALLYLIAVWAILTGIAEVAAAFRFHHESGWLLGIGGVLSIVFGVLLFARPGAGALAVVWLIGFYAIVFGATLAALGVRLHQWRRGTEQPAPKGGLPTYA